VPGVPAALYPRGMAVRSRSPQPETVGARPATGRIDPPAGGSGGGHDSLSREVKLLGALLGQVIAEQGGPELLDLVERCRLRSIAYRESGDEAAERALAAELDRLDVDGAESLANAFALYFQLVNLAEERDTVRRLKSEGGEPGPSDEGTPEAAVAWLVERDWSGDRIADLLSRMRITPVLNRPPDPRRGGGRC